MSSKHAIASAARAKLTLLLFGTTWRPRMACGAQRAKPSLPNVAGSQNGLAIRNELHLHKYG